MKKFGLLILISIFISSLGFSQTTLSAGDIAIVGFTFDNPDDFAFVTFVNLEAGTVIRFTDDGWLAAGGFRQGEGGVQYTAPNNIIAGTVIHFVSPVSLPWEVNNTGLGGTFALADLGDQIIAFQGNPATPIVLYALNSAQTGWQADAIDAQTSSLPTSLVNGTSAIALNEVDNGYYSGGPNPNFTTLRLLIGNTINWTTSNTIHFELETLLGGNLPVELTSFSATTIGSTVKLSWNTATEVNNYGFDIERAVISNGERNLSWGKIGFVNGNGNSNSPKDYSFVDDNISSGRYSYRLKQIDNDGQFEYSKIIEVDMNGVKKFELSQNYPNPFNPSTVIGYELPVNGFVSLKVFDVLGNEIATLVNEEKPAGSYNVQFTINSVQLGSGVYFYRLQSGDYVESRKMVILK